MYNIELDKPLTDVLNKVLKHIDGEDAYILTPETAEWNKYNAVATIENLSFVVTNEDELKQAQELLEDEGKHLEFRTFIEPIVGYNRLTGRTYKYLYVPKQ